MAKSPSLSSPPQPQQPSQRSKLRQILGPDYRLGYTLLIPLIIVLFGLLAYPIFTALGITLQNKTVGLPGRFIGLENYRELLFDDPFFWKVVRNGFVFTLASVFLKLVIGMVMAIVLNQPMRFRGLFRGILLMPWVAPTVVTALTWRWILELTGVLNYMLNSVGLISSPIP